MLLDYFMYCHLGSNSGLVEDLLVDSREGRVVEPLPSDDRGAVVPDLNDTRATVPASEPVRAVPNTATVAQEDAVVQAAEVVHVVVAHKGCLDIPSLQKRGEESRVDFSVVDSLLLLANEGGDLLILGDGDVKEHEGRDNLATVPGLELSSALEIPLNLAWANPLVPTNPRRLAVVTRVKEV